MAKRTTPRLPAPRVLVSWEETDKGPVPVEVEDVTPIRNRAERRAMVRELGRRSRGRDAARKGSVPRV